MQSALRQQAQQANERGSQPLEVDGGRCQKRLDAHILQAPTHRSSEAMPSLGLAVKAFGTPAMTLIEATLVLSPTDSSAASPQQRRVIVADHQGLIAATLRQAEQREQSRALE